MDGMKLANTDATLGMLLKGTKTQQFEDAFHYLDGKYKKQVLLLRIAITILAIGWATTMIGTWGMVVANYNWNYRYALSNYEWSTSVSQFMTDVQNEITALRTENQSAWNAYGDWLQQVQDDVYFLNEELSTSANDVESEPSTATPDPAKPEPTTSEYQNWCTGGEARWLPESGIPTTAYIKHEMVPGQLMRVIVTGPEVAFEAVIAPNENSNDLDTAVSKISEDGYATYLIVCTSFEPYQYELKAIKFNGVQLWPVLAEQPEKAEPIVVIQEASSQARVTPPTTETRKVSYWEVNLRGWEVIFDTKYVEYTTGRKYIQEGDSMYDPNYPGSYYPGPFLQVATCNENDLQAIKDVLINNALRGNDITFEYVSRWGKDFLTGITKGLDKETEWRVCTDWFSANGVF